VEAHQPGNFRAIAPGFWYIESVSYTAQAQDAGKQPTIYLVNDGGVAGQVAQVSFDVPVPESSEIALLFSCPLFMFYLARRRRREVKYLPPQLFGKLRLRGCSILSNAEHHSACP
jgi:hypothetical protein